MAGAIHQAEIIGFCARTDDQSASELPSIAQFSKESLWMHGSCRQTEVDDSLKGRNLQGDAAAYVSLLRACAKNKDLCRGNQVYDDIVRNGLLDSCSNALVAMYAKCGDLGKARELLDVHKSRDITAWTALIAGYAGKGQCSDALDCFDHLRYEGIRPDAVTYMSILKVCACIRAVEKGKEIHEELEHRGLLRDDLLLGTALVDMYAKCGTLSRAQDVLDMLPSHDAVSWNALIAGYVQNGHGKQALNCYKCMQSEGIHPNGLTYACILKACITMGAKEEAGKVHDEIVRKGLLHNDLMLGTTLIDAYVKWGDPVKAQYVLEKLAVRDVVAWNGLIGGFTQVGDGEKALNCLQQMQREGIPPNAVTYVFILKSCASLGMIHKGRQFHREILKQGLLQDDVFLGNALVDMYAKFGDLSEAQNVFESLSSRDIVSWSTLISGYVQRGQGEQALLCFERVKHDGFPPNAVTYVSVLKACATIGALDRGEKIHDEIIRDGLMEGNFVLQNSLVDMYSKCGALSKAQDVLESHSSGDVIAWSTLIAGYIQEGQGEKALNCFRCMEAKGILPDAATYACILKACANIGNLEQGEYIHEEVLKQGLLKDNVVLGSAIIDMYAKCGALSKAQTVLEQLSFRDIVSWNALIAGYVQKGQVQNALNCYEQIQQEHACPNVVTFICLLNACSHLGLVDKAHALFTDMKTKYGISPNLECYTCIINLLGRAGHLEKIVQLMQEMPSFDCSAIWLAILGACQEWGNVNVARWAFEQALQVEKIRGSAYILMANTFAAADKCEKVRMIKNV